MASAAKRPRRMPPSHVRFRLHRRLWEYRLDDLRGFLRISEAGLSSKFEDWGDWYKRRTEGFSDEEKQEFIDFYYDDLSMVRDTAPNLFRRSAFVMTVGFFEASVADLCRLLHGTGSVRRSPKQKLYLDASREYLVACAQLPDSLFDECWDYCKQIEYLRNAIIHNNGEIPSTATGSLGAAAESAKSFVRGHAHVSLDDHGEVVVGPPFCESVLDQYEQIVRRLLDAIEAHYFPAGVASAPDE